MITMPAIGTAPLAPPMDTHHAVERIAAFIARASFEATRLAAGDIAALSAFGGRPRIYVSAVPSRPAQAQIGVAANLAAAGFEPVPHLAVRSFASAAALDAHLARLVEEAGVRRVLIIGGDRATPAGPFHAAIEAIESGLMQARGIVEIGVAGYPDGHPRLTTEDLDRALAAKLEAAAQTGLGIHVVTQWSFSPDAVLAWIRRLRDLGVDHPVRIGLAGPVTLAGLARYARICGVSASLQGLARDAGLARQLFGMVTPDHVLRPLADATDLGDVAPHVFSFGGLAAAARWAAGAAAGHLVLNAEGFSVEPP
jgi:methylenetetrahydrofolate reductase (NADPH)